MPSAANSRWLLAALCSASAVLVIAIHPAPAGAATPTVDIMVTGPSGTTIAGPKRVMPGANSLLVSKNGKTKRCAIPGSTPLAALKLAGISFGVTDYGACSSKPADSASLFVTRIGTRSGSGLAGWNYKVGTRSGTAGAGDPAGPFGSGPLKSGSRVLWFWCLYDPETYACQRTLSLAAPSSVRAGQSLTVKVRAYDDLGRATAAAGVRVTGCGIAGTVTGSSGQFQAPAPATKGTCSLTAVDATGGARPSAFPVSVKVN